MSFPLVNQVRLEQTRRQLSYLQDEVAGWLKVRRLSDSNQQYHTQLNVLEGVLVGAMERIRAALDGVALDTASSNLYSTCRVFESRIVWVRRIWNYFREKFDQRDHEVLGPLLRAADEVVWSCYAEVFQRASARDPDIKQGPAPLAYVDLGRSPHAIPRAEPPADLKSDVDAPFLREYLRQLPIPIVALPVNCVADPWWLVSLGHEVGHHVQYDLLPDWQLVELFAREITKAVSGGNQVTIDDQLAQRWENWGREIFADFFSILCMGPWALWAINELELADDQAMLKSKTLYPSVVARLSLMQQLALSRGLDASVTHQVVKDLTRDKERKLSLLSPEQLRQIAGAEDQGAATDLALGLRVADAIVNLRVGKSGLFSELLPWEAHEFEPYQNVFNLASQLLQPNPPRPLKSLRGARLFTSAAVAAWAAVSTEPSDERRQEQRTILSRNTLLAISASRQEGTRAAKKYSTKSEIEEMGSTLGSLLLEADANELSNVQGSND